MISPSAAYLTALGNKKRKPVYTIEIDGYDRVFSTEAGLTAGGGVPTLVQANFRENAGGLSSKPTDVKIIGATKAGNIVFAFFNNWFPTGAGSAPTISDTAAWIWNPIASTNVGGRGYGLWWAVADGQANDITFHTTDASAQWIDMWVGEFARLTTSINSVTGNGPGTDTLDGVAVTHSGVGTWAIVDNTVPVGQKQWTLVFIHGVISSPLGTTLFINAGSVVLTGIPVDPWLASIDPVTLTVSDMDGGADLSDLSFNVQDYQKLLTADLATTVFEGKKVVLKEGVIGMAVSDFLPRFTGRINTVASDNANLEYKFTCPDIRQDLSKIIFKTGDDGFPTDSNHPKTLNGHPLDILIDLLQTEVGWTAAEIDIAGIQNYRDTVFSGDQMEFTITSPPAAKDFIENEILKPRGAYHWPDNLGIFRLHFFHTLAPLSVATLDHDSILNVPLAEEADLIDQITFRFDEDANGKFLSELVRDWKPGVNKYGLFGDTVIESAGMRAKFQGYFMGSFISGLIFGRYGNKQLQIEGLQTRWSQSLLDPGDIVSLTSALVPDRQAGVVGVTAKMFEVLDRSWDFMNQVATYKVLEINLANFTQFLITTNAEADFTSASSADKAKYLFLCDTNDEYSDSSPANTLC